MNIYHRPDILAPAGGREQFITALNAGADAIYLGLKDFNARGRAENFSIEELKALMPLAQEKKCKILVTLNIVLKESELNQIIKILIELEWLGIYAVIIQDIGLALLIKKHFPSLRIHASTQLAIHNLDGVRQAIKLGFSQIVLARELTLREITNIRQNTPPEINLEIFCHGSLCYSYSGLCFFSGAENARSGNRGECAYTCRKPYKILNEPGHGFLFSMKDLNTSHTVKDLIATGINTLKIEGRMKDSQYVATTIGLYKKQIEQALGLPEHSSRNFSSDSLYAFQRETTSLFFKSRYDENVIDLNNPTHKGVFIGTVQKIYKEKIIFETSEFIELHDGLKMEQQETVYHAKPQHGENLTQTPAFAQDKYKNKNLQFAISKIEVNQKLVSSAEKGQTVCIYLPEKIGKIHVGDKIYKVRSNELKRYTDSLQHLFTREIALDKIQLSVMTKLLDEKTIAIIFKAQHPSGFSFKKEYQEHFQETTNTGILEKDLFSLFSIFGDFSIKTDLTTQILSHIFIQKSTLKQIKRKLGEELRNAITHFKKNKINNIVCFSNDKGIHRKIDTKRYILKIDRLEYLLYIEEYLQQLEHLNITEIIFEPKKAFLPKEKPSEVLEQLMEFTKAFQCQLRLAIPIVLREWDLYEIKNWINCFYQLKQTHLEVGNLGAYHLIQNLNTSTEKLNISADFTLYTLNHLAIEALKGLEFNSFCYSIEDDFSNLKEISQQNLTNLEPRYILYKDTPLFIAEACSLTALHNGCPTGKVCGYRTLHVEDENGDRYFIAHETCKSVVYAEKPFCVIQDTQKIQGLGVNHFRLDFLTKPYTKEEFFSVLLAAHHQENIAVSHSANLYGKLL